MPITGGLTVYFIAGSSAGGVHRHKAAVLAVVDTLLALGITLGAQQIAQVANEIGGEDGAWGVIGAGIIPPP